MTSRCIDGETRHEKSVVRQVYTSSVQPHWQRRRCSRASRSAAETTTRDPGFGGSRTGRDADWSIANRLDESRPLGACAWPRNSRASTVTATGAAVHPEMSRAAKARRFISGCSTRRDGSVRRSEHGYVACLTSATALGLWPHDDQTADRHQRSTEPHPNDERIEGDAQFGDIAAHSGQHHVRVELRGGPNTDFGGRLEGRPLRAVEVLPLFGRDEADWLAIAVCLEGHRGDNAVEALVRRRALTDKAPVMTVRIVGLELLARAKRDVVLGAEGEPREGGKEHDNAGVHDVAAVPPPVARHEPNEATGNAFAVDGPACVNALVELL